MQTVSLPKTLCEEIDKICRGFIWGDTDQGRKTHLIAWASVCKPKRYGGLGLRKTRETNLAYMMRASWRLCSQKDSLWIDVVRKKYGCGMNIIPSINRAKPGSNFWRGLCSVWDLFLQNTTWRIGNGNSVKFWQDRWVVNSNPLIEHATGIVTKTDCSKSIMEYVTDNGAWNVQLFSHLIPDTLYNRIIAMVPPHTDNAEDCLAWKYANDGIFSMASTYETFQRHVIHPANKLFIVVWNWKGPERIRSFMWKISHAALLTNERRFKRGLALSDKRTLYSNYAEDHFHIFRNCEQVKQAWSYLLRGNNSSFFMLQDWTEWLYSNLLKEDEIQGVKWNIIFGVMLDKIWWRRNKAIFNNKIWSSTELIHRVKGMTEAIIISRENNLRIRGARHNCEYLVQVRWPFPNIGQVALNCDGSVTNAGAQAACGGVLRDEWGNFIFGYAINLGSCTILAAELWGIFHRLKAAWNRRFRYIRICSDSILVINLLTAGCCISNVSHALVSAIHEVHKGEGDLSWQHVPREVNQVADALAKFGLSLDFQFKMFHHPPSFISNALRADVTGTWFPRGF